MCAPEQSPAQFGKYTMSLILGILLLLFNFSKLGYGYQHNSRDNFVKPVFLLFSVLTLSQKKKSPFIPEVDISLGEFYLYDLFTYLLFNDL